MKHREIVGAAEDYLAEHRAELIPAAQEVVERWTAAGVFGKRAQRAFANLNTGAQKPKP
jgi:hypothetical protein